MKKIIIVISVIAVVAVVIIAAFAYLQVQEREALRNIKISVDDVEVASVNLSTVSLIFSLRLTNPNTHAATLDRTDYTVLINNVTLGNGQNLRTVTIPAGGSVVIPQPFTVSYSGAAQTAVSYIQQKGGTYNLVGTAYFDTPLGTASVPYNITGTL